MKYRSQRATATAGATAMSIAPGVAWQVEEVRVHLDAAGTAADLTVTLDAAAGAVHDAVFLSQDMNGISDLVWQPTRPHIFGPGDELDIAWTNTADRTWGVEVYYSAI